MVDANNNIAKEVAQKTSIDQNQSFFEDNPRPPIFQEFSWYEAGPKCHKEFLIQDAHDIANGIATIMGLLESSEMAIDSGDAPIIAPVGRGHLTRMVIASAYMLSSACSRQFQVSNDEQSGQRRQAGAPQ
jgi:hypothetical protein